MNNLLIRTAHQSIIGGWREAGTGAEMLIKDMPGYINAGSWGEVLCQQLVVNGYTIVCCEYTVHLPFVLYLNHPDPVAVFEISGGPDSLEKNCRFSLRDVHGSAELLPAGEWCEVQIYSPVSLVNKVAPIRWQKKPLPERISRTTIPRRTRELVKLLLLQLNRNIKDYRKLNGICLELVAALLDVFDQHIKLQEWKNRKASSIQDLVAFIDSHLNASDKYLLTPRKLAIMNSLSSYQFNRMFKQEFGLSLAAYLLSCRMQLAKRLVSTTLIPFGQISYDCGYIDLANFSRAFKNYHGLTPSQLRHMDYQPK